MCRERWRTRDLLLEYDMNILPPRPRAAGISMVYPWEATDLALLAQQVYEIAKRNGFVGEQDEFWSHFNNSGTIYRGKTIDDFPTIGMENTLYFDEETEILYYFKSTRQQVNADIAARIDIAIVGTAEIDNDGTTETVTYMYVPVRAMPIENLIYNCGDASEYIG